MFKLMTFKGDAAFWPLAQPADLESSAQSRSLFSGMLAAPRGLVSAVAKEWSARRAVHALASLDDRMLRDIGLERSQIGFAVRSGRHAVSAHAVRDDISRWG